MEELVVSKIILKALFFNLFLCLVSMSERTYRRLRNKTLYSLRELRHRSKSDSHVLTADIAPGLPWFFQDRTKVYKRGNWSITGVNHYRT